MGEFTISGTVNKRFFIYPASDVDGCIDFTPFGETNNYACVDDEKNVPDDDITYVYTQATDEEMDLYNPSAYVNIGWGTVDWIKIYARAKSHNAPQASSGIYKILISPECSCISDYASDDINITTQYNTYSHAWTENPVTSSAWDWDVFGTCFGIQANSPPETTTGHMVLRPNSNGSDAEHTPLGCTNNYQCCDEAIQDGDTTYVYSTSAGGSAAYDDNYGIENPTGIGTITKVAIFVTARSVNDGESLSPELYVTLRTNGGWWDGDDISLSNFAYQTFSEELLTNPITGVAWTWADITNLQIGFRTFQFNFGAPKSHEARITQVYAVVYYSEGGAQPEIRTTQVYGEVSITGDGACTLSKPEKISTDHARNIMMLNFWGGTREVYDLNRSGKSMVLNGLEYSTEKTAFFEYVDYDIGTEWETAPSDMADGDTSTCAATTIEGDTERLTENTYGIMGMCVDEDGYLISNLSNCGKIKQVSIKVYAAWKDDSADLRIQPIFASGLYGDEHDISLEEATSCSDVNACLLDITDDTNAPTSWTWNDIAGLDINVEARNLNSGNSVVLCSLVSVYVTYDDTCCRMLCVRDIGKQGDTITVDGLGNLWNGTYKIRSFGWNQISKYPKLYEWIMELEDTRYCSQAGDGTYD